MPGTYPLCAAAWPVKPQRTAIRLQGVRGGRRDDPAAVLGTAPGGEL